MKNANFARFCRKNSIPVIGIDIGNTHIPLLIQDEYLRFLDDGRIVDHLQNPEIPAPPGNCSGAFVAEGADPDEIYRSRIEIIIL